MRSPTWVVRQRLQLYGLVAATLFILFAGQGCDQAAPTASARAGLAQLRVEPHFDTPTRAALTVATQKSGLVQAKHGLVVPDPVKVVVTVEGAEFGQLKQELLPSGGIFGTAEIVAPRGAARTVSVVYVDIAGNILGFGSTTVDLTDPVQTISIAISNGLPDIVIGTTAAPVAVVQGQSAAITSQLTNGRTVTARVDTAGHRFRLLPNLVESNPVFQDGNVLPNPPFTLAPRQSLTFTANATVTTGATPGLYRVDGVIIGSSALDQYGLRVSVNPGQMRVVKSRATVPFANLATVRGLAADGGGDVYASAGNQIFRSISRGTPAVVAGSPGPAGFLDNANAMLARFDTPRGLAVTSATDVLIADSGNDRIRLLSAAGVSTVAGDGSMSAPTNNVTAGATSLKTPFDVRIVPGTSDYLIADTGNNMVRRVDGTTNIITAVAGNGSPTTMLGASADTSSIERPTALAFDLQGNLLIGAVGVTGTRRGLVLKLTKATNTLSILAGTTDVATPIQDGVAATSSAIEEVHGIAVDTVGNVYVSTQGAQPTDGIVRQITPEGIILTVAGNKTGPAGAGNPATSFALTTPENIIALTADELLIALTGDGAIRSLR